MAALTRREVDHGVGATLRFLSKVEFEMRNQSNNQLAVCMF